jgi:hypothetical protein
LVAITLSSNLIMLKIFHRLFCWIEQTEDRIWELEDEIVITEKTKELLVKQHKICEYKMQELTYSIKRLNLRIMGTEEGEEVQKGNA